MTLYDKKIYSPLQTALNPIVEKIPRNFNNFPLFTANNITFLRTLLIIPIAWFLKYDFNYCAFLMVVLHDFLDHLDGIVAKVHSRIHPNEDDPKLGGFLDAFCDKIVNIISLLSILQTAQFHSFMMALSCAILFYAVIGFETKLGIVRVQDFFAVKYNKDSEDKVAIAASMEGKLKEKLESMGIAFFCLAINKNSYFCILNYICKFPH